MTISSPRLIAPALGTGLLMAGYLLLRPYGDAQGALAHAFASTRWVAAHVCGALALASFARLTLRLDEHLGTRLSRAASWAGLAGTVLVLPYYGAETFALHVIGARALTGDVRVLELVPLIRNQPVALTMFGVGLLLLAAGGVIAAIAWQRERGAWTLWPLGALMAGVLPQFYRPPVGRMAFGVLVLVAAGLWVWSLRGHGRDAAQARASRA